MAELGEKQKQAGLLTEDAAPIKLNINPPIFPEIKKEEKPTIEISKVRPGITFEAEEEEEDPAKKKRRTLVKLEYEGDGLSEAEKVAKRNAKLLEIRAQVSGERKRLWVLNIEWAAINEVCPLLLSAFGVDKSLDCHPPKAAPVRAGQDRRFPW